jgi:hypothetical protein
MILKNIKKIFTTLMVFMEFCPMVLTMECNNKFDKQDSQDNQFNQLDLQNQQPERQNFIKKPRKRRIKQYEQLFNNLSSLGNIKDEKRQSKLTDRQIQDTSSYINKQTIKKTKRGRPIGSTKNKVSNIDLPSIEKNKKIKIIRVSGIGKKKIRNEGINYTSKVNIKRAEELTQKEKKLIGMTSIDKQKQKSSIDKTIKQGQDQKDFLNYDDPRWEDLKQLMAVKYPGEFENLKNAYLNSASKTKKTSTVNSHEDE